MKKNKKIRNNEEEMIENNDEEEEMEPQEEYNNLSKEDNNIYFYNPVNTDSILKLQKDIRKISNMLLNRSNVLQCPVGNIFLHINSMGGSLFDGFLGSDVIRTNKVPITTIIESACASAATFISIAGKKRLMHKNSFVLIHQLSSGAVGTYENIKDEWNNCSMFMQIIKDLYGKFTKIPNKKLEGILQHDLWFNSDECLKYKIVDEIVD